MVSIFMDIFRLLTFRLSRDEFLKFGNRHLIVGLIFTWIVGIGRYWDNPKAHLLQHLGVGSLIYIVFLTLLIVLVAAPLKHRDLTFRRFLTFVAMVSPPAILYAIPVEKFTDMATANAINAWFLLVVATWRIALLLFGLIRFFSLDVISAATATFLPVGVIVIALVALNLEHTVFNIMGGFSTPSPNDSAYGVLAYILLLAFVLSPVLLVLYLYLIYKARKEVVKLEIND